MHLPITVSFELIEISRTHHSHICEWANTRTKWGWQIVFARVIPGLIVTNRGVSGVFCKHTPPSHPHTQPPRHMQTHADSPRTSIYEPHIFTMNTKLLSKYKVIWFIMHLNTCREKNEAKTKQWNRNHQPIIWLFDENKSHNRFFCACVVYQRWLNKHCVFVVFVRKYIIKPLENDLYLKCKMKSTNEMVLPSPIWFRTFDTIPK